MGQNKKKLPSDIVIYSKLIIDEERWGNNKLSFFLYSAGTLKLILQHEVIRNIATRNKSAHTPQHAGE